MNFENITQILFIFVLLIIFMVVLIKVIVYIMNYILEYSRSPYIFNGIVNLKKWSASSESRTIYTDPNRIYSGKDVKVIPIYRSQNQPNGIEFTWSFWLMLNEYPVIKDNSIYHIFSKGSNPSDGNMNVSEMACPAVYIEQNSLKLGDLSNDKLTLRVDCNTMSNYECETVRIPDIPVHKWINVVIRVTHTILDIYINGRLRKRYELAGIPLQNYGNIYVASGKKTMTINADMSDLRYFNYALQPRMIEHYVNNGPSINQIDKDDTDNKNELPHYLSQKWYERM